MVRGLNLRKLSFFACFLLSVLAIGYRVYIHIYKDDSQLLVTKISENLKSEIQIAEANIHDIVHASKTITNLEFQRFDQHFAFMYHSDSLIFWSTDKFSPDVFDSIEFENRNEWHLVRVDQGAFLQKETRKGDNSLFYYIPLEVNFPISNEYINDYANESIFDQDGIHIRDYGDSASLVIMLENVDPIYLVFQQSTLLPDSVYTLLLLIETVALIVVILIGFRYFLNLEKHKNWISLLLMGVYIIAIKLLLILLGWPLNKELMPIFDSKYFASSTLNSSFGELIINASLLFSFLLFLIFWVKKYISNVEGKHFLMTVLHFLAVTSTLLLFGFIELIYRHSQWIYDISVNFNLDSYKLASILLLVAFSFISFLYADFCLKSVRKYSIRSFWLILGIATILACIFAISLKIDLWYIPLVVMVFHAIAYHFKFHDKLKRLTMHALIYLFWFTACYASVISVAITHMEAETEASKKLAFANAIMNDNDVLAEYSIQQMDASLRRDQFINTTFINPFRSFATIKERIENLYLNAYFDKYNYEILFFNSSNRQIYPDQGSRLSNRVNPNYLSDRNKIGNIELYLISATSGGFFQKKYLYKYPLSYKSIDYGYILIEFVPKKLQPNNVFPELLVDRRFASDFQEIPYNYAYYKADTLAYSVGQRNFSNMLSMEEEENRLEIENHYFAVREGDDFILFYDKDRQLLKYYSNFSFYFLVLFLLIVGWLLYKIIEGNQSRAVLGLNTKIQLFFALAFLIPLLSVSLSTISFVNSSFLKDIVDSYQERTRIAAQNFSYLLSEYINDESSKQQLSTELNQITKYINSDLNLYDVSGRLISSSQPQIFEKNLLSSYMHPQAFNRIVVEGDQSITIEEQIGNLSFQSSFIAVKSEQSGELLGVLGSPFFKSNKEYELLLTDLLTNVFNIFVASILIFLFLATVAGNVLTKPLKLLKEKLGKVNLSGKNEPITWKVDDEIGLLLEEYNQMLIKLEKSRVALQRTEKESAWREMAQQVAHEIKNPLTPMKLSLQHLLVKLKNIPEDTTNAAAKINSILAQVDTLSDIASSFSAFAKMPMPENEIISLTDILVRTITLFENEGNKIKVELPDEEVFVIGDRKLMERICNNLLINAFESSVKEVSVDIKLTASRTKALVSIADTGDGIKEELRTKVFLPNFSTKETGSGIGLAIAKRGIEHAGGKIWFETEEESGSTFYIEMIKAEAPQ